MKLSQVLPHRRIARSLTTILVLAFLQVVAGPSLLPNFSSPVAHAANSSILQTNLAFDANAVVGANDVGSVMTLVGTPTYTNTSPGYYTFDNTSGKYAYKQADFSDNSDVSIFLWVYPTTSGVILSHSGQADPYTGYRLTTIDYTAGYKFEFGLYNSGARYFTSTVVTPPNNWYYIGLTYKYNSTTPASSVLQGYINGQPAGSTTMSSWTTNPGTDFFHLGSYQGGTCFSVGCASGNAATFRFGEMSLYRAALTDAQALSNFNATVSRFAPVATAPNSQSIYTNRSTTFSTSCSGVLSNNGATACAYQWQESTTASGQWSDISGATSASYTTPIQNSPLTGNSYRVRVYDPGSGSPTAEKLYSYSAEASLTVTQLPASDIDYSLSLNGTSQYGMTTSSGSIGLTNAFSLEAWVKPETATANYWNLVICKEGVLQFGFQVVSGTPYWHYGISSSSAINYTAVNTFVPVVLNEWHHVALTRAASTNSVDFYIDGVKYFTGTADQAGTGSLNSTNTYPFSIGARNNNSTASGFFGGQIDHVRIFNTARTIDEINSDMNSYSTTNSSGMTAYYDFNEGGNSTIYNRVSGAAAGSDLTIQGSATYKDVKEIDTNTIPVYTILKFPRTYLTSKGGWTVPSGIKMATILSVAGGGGGGSRHGGGGGGGGVAYASKYALSPGNTYGVIVGQGGIGYGQSGSGSGTYVDGSGYPITSKGGTPSGSGTNGGNSYFTASTIAESVTALGGAGGGGAGINGGSGGGTNRTSNSGGLSTQYSTSYFVGYGNSGANGYDGTACGTDWCGGGGGGALNPGETPIISGTTHAGNGGSGRGFAIVSTTPTYYAGGGGGGAKDATDAATGGAGGGGAGGKASAGSNGTYNLGGGGGGGGFNGDTSYRGGNGGTGVIIIRYITATAPTYTKPTTAYLNVGQTETFTTNVAQDSATVILNRTFKWESTTPTANGTYTLIKQGTGSANASFSWIPSDTTTSGSGYLYRLTVTDSDTAGLFITDSSTAYAIINMALVVSGNSAIGKTINLSKSETFTITLGTSTYRPSLAPVIPGITLDTSTAGIAVVKIADSMTVGTYYETLTVLDSVSASVVTPLTIVIAAPPNFLNTNEIISDGLVLNLDAGNSASFIGADSATASNTNQWRDISGNGKNASTGGTYDGGNTCTSPQYSTVNGGQFVFDGSGNCFNVPNLSRSVVSGFSVESWFKSGKTNMNNYGSLIAQYQGSLVSYMLGPYDTNQISASIFTGTWTVCKSTTYVGPGVWTHAMGTFDGTYLKIYINGLLENTCTVTGSLTNQTSSGTWIGRRWDQSNYFNGSIATSRIYARPLTLSEIQQNYNATKYRFLNSNVDFINPSQKYGNALTDTFTATAGYGSDTISYVTGSKPGLTFSTSGAVTSVRIGETLSATTHLETITVTDSLGASTYLPLKITVSKADTLTITVGSPLTTVYTGSAPTGAPKAGFSGLAGVDSATITTSYYSLSCAQGGACNIGDVGPGGGYVFYISKTIIDSATGVSNGGIYLEVAPKNWNGSGSNEAPSNFATNAQDVPGTSSAIGTGAENSRLFRQAIGDSATAVTLALNKTYNSVSDWFVPSYDELVKAITVLTPLGLGGFGGGNLWSSTQTSGDSSRVNNAWAANPPTLNTLLKSDNMLLRPIRAFSPTVGDTTTPIDADTYTVLGTNLTFNVGALSNYVAVVYETSTLKITQANQAPLQVNLYGAVAGMPHTILVFGGSGSGAISETVTAGSTATNCRISNHILSNDNGSRDQKACNIRVTKASSKNYLAASLDATVYFMVLENNQPTGQVGGGTVIALNGANSLTVEDSSTTRAPNITGFSLSGSTLTLNGSGFGSSPVTIWFQWMIRTTSNTPTLGGTVVTVTVPGGSTSGQVRVVTPGGEAWSDYVTLP